MKNSTKILIAVLVAPLACFDFLLAIINYGTWDFFGVHLTALLIAIPMGWVKVGVIAIFLGLAVWAFTLPKKYVMIGAEDQGWWRDLRYWAAIVIGLEIIPYLIF